MKKLIFLIFSSLTFTITKAQKQIAADSALYYTGQKLAICDSVYSNKVLPYLTFLNFGDEYPSQKITHIFYKRDLLLLEIEPEKLYKGKKICVSGEISQYERKPQIIVKSLRQIELNK